MTDRPSAPWPPAWSSIGISALTGVVFALWVLGVLP